MLSATANAYFGPRVRPGQVYVIRGDDERIYYLPPLNSGQWLDWAVEVDSRIREIPNGAKLHVAETRGGFAKVRAPSVQPPSPGDEGWVNLDLLSPDKLVERGPVVMELTAGTLFVLVFAAVVAGGLTLFLWAVGSLLPILLLDGKSAPATLIQPSSDAGVFDREIDTSP